MNRAIRNQVSVCVCVPRCHAVHGAVSRGLTLIELLVVIVILVTLVGGVLPLLSPNNDSNKIQSASRSLQTYFQKAQTKAIRNGRPVGVMFREAQPGDGYALEAYQVEVPPAFTGFSSASTARFRANTDTAKEVPGELAPTGSYTIEFGEGYGGSFVLGPQSPGAIPPRTIKVGDLLEVSNSVFRLEVEDLPDRNVEEVNGEYYFRETSRFVRAVLVAGPSPPMAPIDAQRFTFPNSYSITRQPVINSESPLTFPKGVVVDMSASGTEGGTLTTLFAGRTDGNALKHVGIMLSPTGGVQNIYYNGYAVGAQNGSLIQSPLATAPISNIGQVLLLLTTIEKSGLDIANYREIQEQPWVVSSGATKEQVAEAREKVSWLSGDSRWVSVKGRSNSIRVAENSIVDPRDKLSAARDRGSEALDQIFSSRGEATLFRNLARDDRMFTTQ